MKISGDGGCDDEIEQSGGGNEKESTGEKRILLKKAKML